MRSMVRAFTIPSRAALAALALAAAAPAAAADSVPAGYAAALQTVVGPVSAKEAAALWKAGVTPAYAQALRPMFASLDAGELRSLRRLDVSPEEALAYRRVGVPDAATLIRLRGQQITPRMARELAGNDFLRRPFETMNPGPW